MISFLVLAAAVALTPEPPAVAPAVDEAARELAEDAARDLKESRFYNRPGATRADYNQAWNECRLIARGSLIPGRLVPIYKSNDATLEAVSNVTSFASSFIAGAIEQGQARRENRRECLMVRGWRLVEVDDEGRKLIDRMSAGERDRFFNYVVGAHDLQGLSFKQWANDFAQPRLLPEHEQ